MYCFDFFPFKMVLEIHIWEALTEKTILKSEFGVDGVWWQKKFWKISVD